MLGSRLLLLIQAHAGSLTHDVVTDLMTNERTPAFRRLNPADVETRVAALFYNLGKWIGDADEDAVQAEYEDLGRTRFREGVPVSELVYALVITKNHMVGARRCLSRRGADRRLGSHGRAESADERSVSGRQGLGCLHGKGWSCAPHTCRGRSPDWTGSGSDVRPGRKRSRRRSSS